MNWYFYFITDQTENVYPMVPRKGTFGNDLGLMIVERRDPRHVISLILENESGALSRVSGLFSARGYNIESLTVAPTNDPTVSRMTIVTRGSDEVVTQITKQLNKLVDVIKLVNLTEGGHIERELLLVKLRSLENKNEDTKKLVEEFNARFLDTVNSDKTYIIELTLGALDDFLDRVDETLVVEAVRTGASGIGKGSHTFVY